MLLVPDHVAATDPRVMAWVDAAFEVGTRIAPVTDSQFLSMTLTASAYAGLVLPDQIHTLATDELIEAVRLYTAAGGKTLLTFDFGALTRDGNGDPVYPIPRSRLSDMAGVDYVLYDELRDRTVGLGPVTALRSTLRELLVPPGKSMPYTEPVPPEGSTARTASTSVIGAAGLAAGQALYLGVSPADPGGVRGFDPQQFQELKHYAGRGGAAKGPVPPRTVEIDFGRAYKRPAVSSATRAVPVATATAQAPAAPRAARIALAPTATDPLEGYHGYLLGHLIYPSFVTSGTYTGVVLAAAPQFGLAAGVRSFGAGQVLFVNMPLGYLKGRTDALPMHGFLRYFMRNVVRGAELSAMPDAVAGMTFDWHLDSMDAQEPTLALESAGFFNTFTFSMEMTAGPDTITPGDGLGWDVPNNPVAQGILQRLHAKGHAMGSHGGWIHDYYGDGATEDNKDDYLPYLVMNRDAVDGAIGRTMRGYSAPQGNNPLWAMDWLEQQGVVAAYFGGHTGLGATRQYRDGVLKNPSVWVFPVTPQGVYATFEEWQDYAVPKADVAAWYREMVDFAIAKNTSRMVYAHPPGADEWRDVLAELLAYSQGQGASRFRWYTMPRLADFMALRAKVSWTQAPMPDGSIRFAASHPASLAEMAWRLPKDRYLQPVIVGAGGTVSDGGDGFWIVNAPAAASMQFTARPSLAPLP